MKIFVCGLLVGLVVGASEPVAAQDSKSAALVKELAAALDAAKLDSVAAKHSGGSDMFIGALYIPGVQLLTISAKYAAPVLLDTRISKKEYRDVYIDLNTAGSPGTRLVIEDLGPDGLKPRRAENQPFDSIEMGGKRTAFDNDWRRQQLSEQEYMKAYSAGDEQYVQMLTALLAELKK